ncbi:hypothetical protein [Bifidobacterium adolescentis]|uniref:hypothetical protein n=1 Tax=Bifidobacterium adolescentis TaxID=1680 RepID=UPI0034A2C730
MTQVKFDLGKLDTSGVVDLANDPISVTPSSRFATATKKIVVDETLKTNLDTHGVATLNLPPTGKDWAYTLTVGAGTRHEFNVTFDVPDSSNPVNFADLVTVDPTTLIPNAGNPLSDIDQSDIDWAVSAINA